MNSHFFPLNYLKFPLVLILFLGLSFCQETRSLNIFIGHQQLSTSTNDSFSDFSSGNYFGVSKNLGFLFINTPINFGFQFSERGGNQKINLSDYLVEGNSPPVDEEKINLLLKYSYFDFFINATVNVGNLSFYIGPVVGINLSSEVENLILPAIYTFDENEFKADKFDYGMNAGITFHLNRLIGISGEFYQGKSAADNQQEFRNFGLKLSVGF
tara:strand:+ start:2209 stop:2847 length:639 start_codon:yes stop_codon:yes gene_type:complete